MKILIVAATWLETGWLSDEFKYIASKDGHIKSFSYNYDDIDILITGFGATSATYRLTKTLSEGEYEYVVNIGLAGCFCPELKIGQVVNIVSEEFADLGVEKKEGFVTLFEAGYIKPDEFPFVNGAIRNETDGLFAGLPPARAISSGRTHTFPGSIGQLRSKYKAQVESMEGASVFYVCKQMNVPFAEIRAISNFTGLDGITVWNIPLALDNLKKSVLGLLSSIKPIES